MYDCEKIYINKEYNNYPSNVFLLFVPAVYIEYQAH